MGNLMPRKVFTSQKLSLFLSGKEFRVQALVSVYGAKYVFDDEDLPDEARSSLGLDVQAAYKGIPVRCRFLREVNGAGAIYSLRFLNPTSLFLRQVERDVETTGLPSPWMRGLPRLNTTSKHLPVPVLAVVQTLSNTYYMNVRNFTLGGLMLEYSGSDAGHLVVGSRFMFDLVTNGGDKLPDIQAQVTHLTEEKLDGQAGSRYQFGLKLLPLGAIAEMRYRNLIKAHCEGLRDELEA
jgi:hypothetical protein